MYSSAYVWAKVLSHMEEKLGSIPVSSWFDDAEVVELNENNLIIYSPSDFRRDIIRPAMETVLPSMASKSARMSAQWAVTSYLVMV